MGMKQIGKSLSVFFAVIGNAVAGAFSFVGRAVLFTIKKIFNGIAWTFRHTVFARGRGRTRLVLLAVFLCIIFLGNLDYPNWWNKAADAINPKLEVFKQQLFIAQHTQKGIAHTIVQKIYIKHYFWNVPFLLGLDLQGGAHLVYEADNNALKGKNADEAMASLRDLIERRVNLLGVSEPLVQVEQSGNSHRLIVELAGVYDTNAAIAAIGKTPYLEFREVLPDDQRLQFFQAAKLPQNVIDSRSTYCTVPSFIGGFIQAYGADPCFTPTKLNGQYLAHAQVSFSQNTNQPEINLAFNGDGSKLFEDITGRNVGKPVAIYLDNVPLSIPTVQQKIVGGNAQITGNFTVDEAKTMVSNLNAGALPVPISLISQQTVGATLGQSSIAQSLRAGLWGVLLVVLFMLLIYRFSGFLSVIALFFYAVIVMAVFKLLPVTLTLPGLAGFILSVGMAVDANVLVFERLKEEFSRASGTEHEGVFSYVLARAYERAWPSVRDGHISTLITCVVLFFFTTSFVKGFALTLGIGVLASLLSAMVVTRSLMQWFAGKKLEKYQWLWTR